MPKREMTQRDVATLIYPHMPKVDAKVPPLKDHVVNDQESRRLRPKHERERLEDFLGNLTFT